MKNKVLGIASAGGHLTQLRLSLREIYTNSDVVIATTNLSFVVGEDNVYCIPDFSRENIMRGIRCYRVISSIISEVKPDAVISTGAAPGLIGLLAAKFRGIPTIWLDSCANYGRVSLSGRIAACFVDVVLTQWPHLASRRIKYRGNVL